MKKINNWILVIAFVSLALIFVLTRLFRSPALESNLDTGLLKVDTAAITEIRIQPQKDSMTEIRLVRTGNQWTATRKHIQAAIPIGKIRNLLYVIHGLRPERVVSRKEEKWVDYQVTDSSATKVIIFDRDEPLLDLKIGKVTGNDTYARANDADEVYLLEGELQSSFNTTFSDWRNQSFLRLTKNTINRIDFRYPADTAFTIEKQNKVWMIGNKPADSVKVDSYLSKLTFRDHTVFADHFLKAKDPDITITFRSEDTREHVVKGWRQSFDRWVLHSSLQPETYFLDPGPVLAKDLFARKKDF
jgi:hypothetical protein